MRRAETVAALATLAFGTFVVVQARALEDPGLDAIGPGAFPAVLGLVIAACGVVLLVQALAPRRREAEGDAEPPTRFGVLAVALALLVAYARSLEWIGFSLATVLFVAACLALLGVRSLARLVVTGIAVSLAVTVVFGRLLGVDLPAGRLFGG
ncbi:MAG TPA: tripartite tricarboxylate transporter TctB family protein [Thermodesulfobacteriota bacterium]